MDLRENKALTPVESGMPIVSCTIDLTKRCNLACDYCFAHCFEKDRDRTDLEPELGKRIIDWLFLESTNGGSKNLDISFWGGEPLLKWDLLKELVLYAEEKAKGTGIRVTFGGTTNVTLLTPDKFDFMDEHNIRFLLSIDGTKEHHDRHRVFANGKGSWDIIDKNATEILKRWPDHQVRFSYSVENLDGMMEDLNYLYDKGFHDIVYSPVSEGNWTEERIEKLKSMWNEIADWYIAKKQKGQPIRLKFLEDACKAINGIHRGEGAPCGAGRGYVGVTVDGSIYPCHRFNKFDDKRPWYEREVCIGHIDHGILNQPWRARFVNWSPKEELPESCKECKAYLKSCGGGCWATNWDVNGSLEKVPKVNCEAELATMAQAEKAIKELGQGYVNSMIGGVTPDVLPEVQGCQCYNRHDDLFGRMTVNEGDRFSCLCNMSTYGVTPKSVDKCTCYNVENNLNGINHAFYDKSGATCKMYMKSPIDEALEYLKRMGNTLDTLTEIEMKKVEEFITAKEYVDAKKEELEQIQNIEKQLKTES